MKSGDVGGFKQEQHLDAGMQLIKVTGYSCARRAKCIESAC